MTESTLAPTRLRTGHHQRPDKRAGFPLSSGSGVGIRVILDLPYAGDVRNKLDLYLPDRATFPVVVFVHGGAWVSGDKAFYSHEGHRGYRCPLRRQLYPR